MQIKTRVPAANEKIPKEVMMIREAFFWVMVLLVSQILWELAFDPPSTQWGHPLVRVVMFGCGAIFWLWSFKAMNKPPNGVKG